MVTARFTLKDAKGDVTTASPFFFQQSDEQQALLADFIGARCVEALQRERSVRLPYWGGGVTVGAFTLPKAGKAGWWIVKGERMQGEVLALGLFHPWK